VQGESTGAARALIMDGAGARAHELGRAGWIRHDSVERRWVWSSMAAGSTDCAFQRARLSGRRQAEPPLGLLRSAFRNATQPPPDDDKPTQQTTRALSTLASLCRAPAERRRQTPPSSACPAPPITVPSLLLLPRTTHSSCQLPHLRPLAPRARETHV
jgi:hypothetical protein